MKPSIVCAILLWAALHLGLALASQTTREVFGVETELLPKENRLPGTFLLDCNLLYMVYFLFSHCLRVNLPRQSHRNALIEVHFFLLCFHAHRDRGGDL